MDATTEAHATDPQAVFSREGAEGAVEYRSLSALSVVSLALGAAAPLVLLAPLLLAISIVGAAVALVSLRRIAQSDGAMAGRGAALVGLALCIASVGALSSRAIVTRHLLCGQAGDVARQWFALVQDGRTQEAFQLTVEGAAYSAEQSSPESSEPQGEAEEHAHDHGPSALEGFVADPLVRALAAVGSEADVRLDELLAYEPGGRDQCVVVQRYAVTPRGQHDGSFSVRMTLRRGRDASSLEPRWVIAAHEREDVADAPR